MLTYRTFSANQMIGVQGALPITDENVKSYGFGQK